MFTASLRREKEFLKVTTTILSGAGSTQKIRTYSGGIIVTRMGAKIDVKYIIK